MLHTSHFNDKYNLIKSSKGITYIFCVLFLKWIRDMTKKHLSQRPPSIWTSQLSRSNKMTHTERQWMDENKATTYFRIRQFFFHSRTINNTITVMQSVHQIYNWKCQFVLFKNVLSKIRYNIFGAYIKMFSRVLGMRE